MIKTSENVLCACVRQNGIVGMDEWRARTKSNEINDCFEYLYNNNDHNAHIHFILFPMPASFLFTLTINRFNDATIFSLFSFSHETQ